MNAERTPRNIRPHVGEGVAPPNLATSPHVGKLDSVLLLSGGGTSRKGVISNDTLFRGIITPFLLPVARLSPVAVSPHIRRRKRAYRLSMGFLAVCTDSRHTPPGVYGFGTAKPERSDRIGHPLTLADPAKRRGGPGRGVPYEYPLAIEARTKRERAGSIGRTVQRFRLSCCPWEVS